MARLINVKVKQNLTIRDGTVKKIFETYYEEGFVINFGEPRVDVNIKDDKIAIDLKMGLGIEKGEESAFISSHDVIVDSQLGNLYKSAKKIYDYEQKELFLEDYAVDILRLYAPVDGVELSCSPLTWNADEVFDELQDAIYHIERNGNSKIILADLSIKLTRLLHKPA